MKSTIKIIAVFICVLFSIHATGQTTIRYVKPTATGLGDGSSWSNASADIQAMIDSSKAYDQVWVAAGKYKPVHRADSLFKIDTANQNNAFVLKDSVKVYGGFKGKETLLDQRNWVKNSTVLSGDFNDDDTITGMGTTLSITGNLENAYHVIISAGLDSMCVLDGFTITGGSAQSSGSILLYGTYGIYQSDGGGINITGSSIIVSNCYFLGNAASLGGGVCNIWSSSPFIRNCNLERNIAGYGGGINNSESCSPLITNCKIRFNFASHGGAINNYDYSSSVISYSDIIGNSAYEGGAIDNGDYSYSSAVLSYCKISKNTSLTPSGSPGVIYDGYYSGSFFTNCAIVNNYGVGIYNNATYGTITCQLINCTVAGNTSGLTNLKSSAGTINLVIYNSIVWSNDSPIEIIGPINYDQKYSLVQGIASTVNGNIGVSTDPFFVNPAIDDFHLQSCSPLINKGSNSLNPSSSQTDLSGDNRIIGLLSPIIDMGAYEYQITNPDLNPTPDDSIIYVNKNIVGGNHDGSSWSNAVSEIADALKAAKNNTGIKQIWVAEGIYKPQYHPIDLSCASIDRNAAFALVPNVHLYGGFKGIETKLDERSVSMNATVLSGDFNNNDTINGTDTMLHITGNNENAYHVLIGTGNSGSALLEGFTITGGNANDSGNITIGTDTIYRNNGGGIMNGLSSIEINRCKIVGNTGINGGGLYNRNATLTLKNSDISRNNASLNGGGIYNSSALSSTEFKLINTSIYGNTKNVIYDSAWGSGSINLDIYNSILWRNENSVASYGIVSTDQKNSLVQGITDSTNNNIDGNTDPLFADSTLNNADLSPQSPCINTGNKMLYGNQNQDRDLIGNFRVLECTIDVGAYEYQRIAPAENSEILYVQKGGSGIQTGDSWANATGELAEALKAARINPAIKQIWVSKGIYKPLYRADSLNTCGDNSDRNVAFVLTENIHLYGGFNGTETDINQRTQPLDSTILSGDLADDDVITGADSSFNITGNNENAYHVLINVGTNNTCALDGFIISGGNADGSDSINVYGSSIYNSNGAGLYNIHSSPAISNCSITDNVSSDLGGGVFNEASSNPSVNHSKIQNNMAMLGGGIYNKNSSSLFNDCNISYNKANNGAGLYNIHSSPAINNCSITGNVSSALGGGVFSEDNSNPLVDHSYIQNNMAMLGGGIYNKNSSPFFNYCNISYNKANSGDGLYNEANSDTLTLELRNCTVYGDGNNVLYDSTSESGIIRLSLYNSIVWGNSDTISNSGTIIIDQKNSLAQGIADTTHHNIYGTIDPLFEARESGNLTLKALSPCVNKGDSAWLINNEDTSDLAGKSRLKGYNVDMGAYEYQERIPQSIIPMNDTLLRYSDTLMTLTAFATSGLYVNYQSEDTTIVSLLKDSVNSNTWKVSIRKTGVVEIVVSQPGDMAYLPADNDTVKLTIVPALLTINADSLQLKTYGQADPDPLKYYISSGKLYYNDSLTGALNRESGDTIGKYQIQQNSLAANSNYIINYISDSFTIKPALLTITANARGKSYGKTDPALTYRISGLTNGDSSNIVTGTLIRDTGENIGKYAIRQGTLQAANYYIVYVKDSFVISSSLLTITADNLEKTYGEDDPALTYTVSGFLNGDDSSIVSGHLIRDAGENAGTYNIALGTITAANYDIVYTNGNLTINRVQLTLTVDSLGKIYGEGDPPLTYKVDGLINGDDSSVIFGALVRSAGENVGVYPITGGNLYADNYDIIFVGDSLTILKKQLVITANAQTKIYGEFDPTLTYSISGLVNGDNATSILGTLSRDTGENVGTYIISEGGLYTRNYDISYIGDSLTIVKAQLDVFADAQTKIYGEADPGLTFTTSGLVLGEGESVLSGKLNRDSGENVGTYGINQGTLNANNYYIVYNTNNLEITPATLSVTALAKTKVYGEMDPDFNYTVDGLLNNDSADVITGHLSRDPGEDIGTYFITKGSIHASNYNINYTGDSLMISPAELEITANVQTKVYGEIDPQLTYTINGLVNGDNSSIISGLLSRDSGENIGAYAINQNTVVAGNNYHILYAGSNLEITPASLNITANPQTKVHGDQDPALTYSVNGLKNGDDTSVVTGSLSRDSGESVGKYAIMQGTLVASDNYTINYTGDSLTITPSVGLGYISQSDKNGSIRAYPNPLAAGSKINLDINFNTQTLDHANVQLIDITGKILLQMDKVQPNMKIAMPEVPGLYIISLILNSGQRSDVKVLVN